jgi:polyhydroxyalkanoate synthesis regulator phasin
MASEEKILILKMLEEGKINSEEAARLIEAVEPAYKSTQNNSSNCSSKQQKKVNFWSQFNYLRNKNIKRF